MDLRREHEGEADRHGDGEPFDDPVGGIVAATPIWSEHCLSPYALGETERPAMAGNLGRAATLFGGIGAPKWPRRLGIC